MEVLKCILPIILLVRTLSLASADLPTAADGTVNHGIPVIIQGSACDAKIRIMSFNTWHMGRHVINGLAKIAKHIKYNNPDIVALQEVSNLSDLKRLQTLMGSEWSIRLRPLAGNSTYPPAIMTKHAIIDIGSTVQSRCTTSKIQIKYSDGTKLNINFWSLHLTANNYGPYAACLRMVTTEDPIIAGEFNLNEQGPSRISHLGEMLNSSDFKQQLQNGDLMIVAGDFNSPSQFDWVDSTTENHCGWTFTWPATKTMSMIGFTDTFREVHPDPAVVPGDTWSPVYKIYNQGGDTWGRLVPEPMDRIDIIFYKGRPESRWQTTDSFVYYGTEQPGIIPDHENNDWPSDHASVVTDLKFLGPSCL